jgi:endo-1,4-beta-D-glucanase Y
MSLRTRGILLIVLAFGILAFVAYKNSARRRVPIIFSPRTELISLWEEYKKEYLEPSTYRVLDKQKEFVTTSEGESYAMLRAVWLDDKDTFDKSWKWTEDNLERKDKLFSWLFGKRTNGTYGVLTERGGQNTATDADTDIALALIFASARWNDASYLDAAKQIIPSIWEQEVVTIKGKPYVVANNVEKTSSGTMVINPSYLAPYAYRIFAKIDTTHPWLSLVDTSYDVLKQSMDASLDTSSSAHIPPDWIFIDKKTGVLLPPRGNNLATTMSFDALRVPWRLALDKAWYNEPRADELLKKMSFLSNEWNTNSILYTSYTHDGMPAIKNQSAAFYGGVLGYFMYADPTAAKAIYDNKLQILFNPDTNTWKITLGYYDDNWAWFGIALYNNFLPNLAEPSP